MEIIKQRKETEELLKLRILNARMDLTSKEKGYYLNLEKGFQGELMFDDQIFKLTNNFLVLNDLLLEYNNSIFQIDSTLIFQNIIYRFEIKNNEGDHYYDCKTNRWYTVAEKEIKNPVIQMERSEPLYRQLLKDIGLGLPIKTFLVFVNPTFHLYNAPLNLPIIFPGQIDRFMQMLAQNQSNVTDFHRQIAKNLAGLHLEKSPYERKFDFEYSKVEKGMSCRSCHSLLKPSSVKTGKLLCFNCGFEERTTEAVLRNIGEFSLLFPEMQITTNRIADWCAILSKKVIRQVLLKNFTLIGHGGSSHYVQKEKRTCER